METTEYVDLEVTFFETYNYAVIAIYDDGCESVSDSLSVTPIPDAVQENETRFVIYPNPAKETLRVEGKGILQVELFNIMGQSVIKIDENFENIRLNALQNGVYFVHLKTCEGEKAIKLIVKK